MSAPLLMDSARIAVDMSEATDRDPLRVVVVDDHSFYRAGLIRLLNQSGVDVVAEAPNGEAAIRAVAETAPDVVVMDMNMPALSGAAAIRILSERVPGCRL